jgi:hypothetical protein
MILLSSFFKTQIFQLFKSPTLLSILRLIHSFKVLEWDPESNANNVKKIEFCKRGNKLYLISDKLYELIELKNEFTIENKLKGKIDLKL